MRILLADDHELTRVGIRVLLSSKIDWQICGEAGNGKDAVALARELQPDVVILDISMKGLNGFETAAEIRLVAPCSKIVFYSMHEVPASARRVGGSEFVCKTGSPRDLLEAVERASGQIAKQPGSSPSFKPRTPRAG